MSQRTIWEEGRESGRHVVALGSATSLTVTFVDLLDRKSTRQNSSHYRESRMPSSA